MFTLWALPSPVTAPAKADTMRTKPSVSDLGLLPVGSNHCAAVSPSTAPTAPLWQPCSPALIAPAMQPAKACAKACPAGLSLGGCPGAEGTVMSPMATAACPDAVSTKVLSRRSATLSSRLVPVTALLRTALLKLLTRFLPKLVPKLLFFGVMSLSFLPSISRVSPSLFKAPAVAMDKTKPLTLSLSPKSLKVLPMSPPLLTKEMPAVVTREVKPAFSAAPAAV